MEANVKFSNILHLHYFFRRVDLFMELVRSKRKYSLSDFLEIVDTLKGSNSGLWDRTQSHSNIRSDLIEEAYEVIEAIDLNDAELLRESLGNVLFQIALHCNIEEKRENFSFEDIIDEICRKIIMRYPHIFSGEMFGGNFGYSQREKIAEYNRTYGRKNSCLRAPNESVAESVKNISKILPSLMRAEKVQIRAARAGYGIYSVEDALNQTFEKLNYLEHLILNGHQENYGKELGDLLFSITEVSRLLSVDAESALYDSCERFKNEFLYKISLENKNKV